MDPNPHQSYQHFHESTWDALLYVALFKQTSSLFFWPSNRLHGGVSYCLRRNADPCAFSKELCTCRTVAPRCLVIWICKYRSCWRAVFRTRPPTDMRALNGVPKGLPVRWHRALLLLNKNIQTIGQHHGKNDLTLKEPLPSLLLQQ